MLSAPSFYNHLAGELGRRKFISVPQNNPQWHSPLSLKGMSDESREVRRLEEERPSQGKALVQVEVDSVAAVVLDHVELEEGIARFVFLDLLEIAEVLFDVEMMDFRYTFLVVTVAPHAELPTTLLDALSRSFGGSRLVPVRHPALLLPAVSEQKVFGRQFFISKLAFVPINFDRAIAMALFRLRRIVGTPAALQACNDIGVLPWSLIGRHESGDWGNLDADDVAANVHAVQHGLRVLSRYNVDGSSFYVITETDRSSTCLLLVHEY